MAIWGGEEFGGNTKEVSRKAFLNWAFCGTGSVYSCSGATIIKSHKLGGSNNRYAPSHSVGGWRFETRHQ